ncbi:plastocyanin/azurin family copper-binding protein [Halosimplex salinum]|uniref:plastocyanin/azurin family copper-binding protein n=1 Tax=Halosimplex salinum TaxID=1710538 RepID=UPI000F4940FD|nr:plastocyanin/azurin family copper-binding protein [Halosimplex salinum]
MSPQDLDTSRRDVMKAVGAGTVLAALGGTAVVSGRDGKAVGEVDAGAVDRHDGLQEAGSVHRVQTLISAPPTNPERPADFFFQPTGLHVRPGDVVRFEFVTPDHNVVSYHPAFGMRRRVPLGVDAISSPLLGWRPDSIPGDMVDPPTPAVEEEAEGTETETPGGETTAGMETETPTATGTATGTGGEGDGPIPDFWLLAFDEPGVYDFLCSPHEVFGMAMRVVVGDETDAPFETEDPEALPEPRVGPVELARETLTDPALAPSNIVEQGTVLWSALEAVQGQENGTGTPDGETETPTDETATPEEETATATETGE